MRACAGCIVTHERGLASAAASARASGACGMPAHVPSPAKRQPWYEHMSVPSDGSMRPSDSGASLPVPGHTQLELEVSPQAPAVVRAHECGVRRLDAPLRQRRQPANAWRTHKETHFIILGLW